MSDYRRLVSYMYNYENGIKSNNIGYARVESRNGQCKVTIRIKLANINEDSLKVFLFKRKGYTIEGILLGEMAIRRGLGQFRNLTSSSDIMGTSYSLDDIGGIVVYHSDKRYFATEWDDKPVTKEMVNLSLTMPKELQGSEADEVAKAVNVADSIDKAKLDKGPEAEEMPLTEEIVEENYLDQDAKSEQVLEDHKGSENDKRAEVEEIPLEEASLEKQDVMDEEVDLEKEENLVDNLSLAGEEKLKEEKSIEKEETKIKEEVNEKAIESDKKIGEKSKAYQASVGDIKPLPQKRRKGQGWSLFEEHPEGLNIYSKYPKMYPFEDNELAWCVRFEPQDIGILPIDNWKLANNSFLLHGFYCYSHLIFARINDKSGVQYILGVPGIYHNREKFMAQMFGFNFFKGIKRKELRAGEFGYWYTPIYFN